MNPNVGEFAPGLVKEFEAILGCQLRVIFRRI